MMLGLLPSAAATAANKASMASTLHLFMENCLGRLGSVGLAALILTIKACHAAQTSLDTP
jgi:hypothetical protein